MKRMRGPASWIGLGISAGSIGCGATDGPPVFVTSRDSAGIAIVENGPIVGQAARWALAEPPAVEMGALEAEAVFEFSRVVGAVRLSDGRIVVGDGASKEVRYFSARGEHLISVGGPGEGPGEFRFLYTIDLLPGDTVVAGGWPIGWSSWFDSDGNHLHDTRIGPFYPGRIGHFLWDGSLLVDVYERGSHGNEIEWWAATGDEPAFRAAGHMALVSRDGSTIDTVGEFLGPEYYKTGRIRQNLALRAAPFPRTTLVQWTRDRLYVGETGKREIRVLEFDGTVERLIRWEGISPLVTRRDREAFREEVLSTLRRPEQRGDFERWLAEVPYPEAKPAFRALAVDPGGRVWIQHWRAFGAERDRWTVFGSDGVIIATVDVPNGLKLLDVRRDAVLALWVDELDLEYVRSYRLRR